VHPQLIGEGQIEKCFLISSINIFDMNPTSAQFRVFALSFLLIVFSCSNKSKNSIESFQIQQGFDLTLVASEPLIKDPVDLGFNEYGDAFVLEMPGYPFEDQQSRIFFLRDKNGDGVFDGTTLFAENLQLATSILPYKKGLLVAAPPYLLHLQDQNNDLKVDAIDTLMGGFATENLQHNYNGLLYGLDNWIYAANGGNSGKPYWWGDTTSVLDLRGQDLRIDLENRVMERLGESSGGFGLGSDEFGRLLETHNLTHISHLVFPDRYIQGQSILTGHSLSNISDHEENGLARIYPIGEQESRVNHPEQSGYFSGSCGVTYYGGGALGEEYSNTVWVADVVLNLIHVDKIKPKGSSFTASRAINKKEFLASTDRSFRPVNMSVGPDGAMFIVDMYRQVIEHPEWIPDEIEKTLDINAGKDKGRIYKITKSNSKLLFDPNPFKSLDGLILSLENPNQWIRKTAHRLLMEQSLNDEGITQLSKTLESKNELARLHALWILKGKKKLNNQQLIRALEDPSSGVRENALVMAEDLIESEKAILEKCTALTNDADPRVRMQAALSISTLSKEDFSKNKIEILNALTKSSALELDEWNVAAITLSSQDASAELFTKLISEKNPNETLLASLALNGGSTDQDAKIILQSLNTAQLASASKVAIIRQLTEGADPQLSRSWEPFIQRLEQTGSINLVAELSVLRGKIKLPPSPIFLKLSREAISKIRDRSLADSLRIEQMKLIALLPYKEKSEVLFESLNNSEPIALQEEALRQLSVIPEKEIGKRIVQLWAALGPHTRRYAGDLLLYIELHHDALLTGLEQHTINIGEMNFDLERRRTLLWWTDNEDTKRRAEALFSDAGITTRKEAIEKMKPALTLQGDLMNGAKVFENVCSNCHIYRSVGKDVGPVLTEINRKSKETLLHDILDPNAAADTKYISHRLESKDGAVHIGIVESETDQSITIKKMGGEKIAVNKHDIIKFSSLGSSLMMEGLEGSMSAKELADLLAFLQNTIDQEKDVLNLWYNWSGTEN
jgi:putative membrane-bound dehydrogenase-like protein